MAAEAKIPRVFLTGILGGDLAHGEVVDWANALRHSAEPAQLNPILVDLASSNPKTKGGQQQITNLLRQLADEWHPDFRNLGPLAEDLAKEALARKGRDLLERRISPCEFCSLVNQFDANLLDRKPGEKGMIEYPKWMGNLWNECDWIGGSFQPPLEDVPTLADEVRKLLATVTDSEPVK